MYANCNAHAYARTQHTPASIFFPIHITNVSVFIAVKRTKFEAFGNAYMKTSSEMKTNFQYS